MLKDSINALIKFAPLMMPEILANARQETISYDDFAIVDFHLDSNVDIHTLANLMNREMEMTTLALSYEKNSELHVFSSFTLQKGGYMWKAIAKSFYELRVDKISFTVYTSSEQMFGELQDELKQLTDTDNYTCEEEIDPSSFVLFFQ